MEIQKFNPTKAELIAVVDEMKPLIEKEIKDVNDFALVDEGRKRLQKMRTNIQRFGKELRADYIAAQKEVIRQENELVEVIDPVEKALKDKQDAYYKAEEKKKRLLFLPARRAQMQEIELMISDDTILAMTDEEFSKLYLEEKGFSLKKKEEAAELKRKHDAEDLRLAQEKLDNDRKELERQKQIEADKIQAAENARLQAIKDAEIEKERVIKQREADARKAEADKEAAVQAEKQKAIDLENKRLADLAKEKQEAEDKRIAEEEERRLLVKRDEWQKILFDAGYSEETKAQFHIIKTDTHMIIYKLINSFKYKD
jgi:colicin import membrane protein